MKDFSKTGFVLLALLSFWQNQMEAQLTMDAFIGVNARREDPTGRLRKFGIVREYHSWTIDEGNFYVTYYGPNGPYQAQPYPDNDPRWNPPYPGHTYVQFDRFYREIHPTPTTGALINTNINSNLGYFAGPFAQNPGPHWVPYWEEMKPVLNQNTGLDPCVFNTNTQTWDCDPSFSNFPSINLTPVNPNTCIPDVPFTHSTFCPLSYLAFSDYIYQFSSKYGSNQADPPGESIKFSENPLPNTISFIEAWNEPDKWWRQSSNHYELTRFSPYEYAAMASAAYDAHGSNFAAYNPSEDFNYLPGSQNADPGMDFVMAGISELNWEYVDSILDWCATYRGAMGNVSPFDVINFHHYSDSRVSFNFSQLYAPDCYTPDPIRGVCPEADVFALSPDGVQCDLLHFGLKAQLSAIRSQVLSHPVVQNGIELWLSEFGYDTNEDSPQRAPRIECGAPCSNVATDQQEIQGQWLVRSYLEIAAAGFDRAMAFCIRDDASPSPANGLFSNSGLLMHSSTGFRPKKSWYYVQTLRNVLRGYTFAGEINLNGCSGNEGTDLADCENATECVRIYQFVNSQLPGKDIYAVWRPTSCNKSGDFEIPFQNVNDLTKIEMVVGDENGRPSVFHPNPNITLNVTERPIFLLLNQAISEPVTNNVTPDVVTFQCCDVVEVTWTNPQNQENERFQIYYALKSDLSDDPTRFFDDFDRVQLYTDNLTPGTRTSATIAGLIPGETYYIYVVPVDENENVPLGVPAHFEVTVPMSLPGTDILPIEDNMLSSNHSGVLTAFNSQSIPNLLDCSDIHSNDDLPDAWYQGNGPNSVIVDFQSTQLLNAIYLNDGSGNTGTLTIEYDDCNCFWYPLITIPLTGINEWRFFSDVLPPNQTVLRLRFTLGGTDAKVDRILFCTEDATCTFGFAGFDPSTIKTLQPDNIRRRDVSLKWDASYKRQTDFSAGYVDEYLIQHSIQMDANGNLVNPVETRVFAIPDESSLYTTIGGLTPNTTYFIRVGTHLECRALVPGGGVNESLTGTDTTIVVTTLPDGGGRSSNEDGKQEILPLSQLVVFPNPAKDELSIFLPAEKSFNRLEMYDINGQMHKHLSFDPELPYLTINIGDLSPGMFFLVVKNNQGEQSHVKVVKH